MLIDQGQPLTKFVSRTIASELKENSIKVDEGNSLTLVLTIGFGSIHISIQFNGRLEDGLASLHFVTRFIRQAL